MKVGRTHTFDLKKLTPKRAAFEDGTTQGEKKGNFLTNVTVGSWVEEHPHGKYFYVYPLINFSLIHEMGE